MVTESRRLPRAEAAEATPEARIASVWPFVVARVGEFHAVLSPRERATLGIQDMLQEVWIELRKKDHKYDPTYEYVTFAKTIVRNLLSGLRDKCGTVVGPKDGRRVWSLYEEQAQAGTLTPQKRRTFEALGRVAAVGSIDQMAASYGPTIDDGPPAEAEGREAAEARRRLVVLMIRKLPPVEAKVLGLLYGLWGRETATVVGIAARMGLTVKDVQNIRRRAFRRIERRLEEVGVTSPFSEN